MGKKLSEASLKVFKNHQKQQQFSSMIKALRPKVYITHSSRFKKLVQELTGNNISATTMSSSSSTLPSPESTQSDVQIIDNLDTSFHSFEVSASSSSEATTSTTTTTSSSEFCCYNNQACLDDTTLGISEANPCMMDSVLAYQNLESLLFDAEVEQSFLYDCYAQPEQEVNTYECELWGLI
ncbi:hypothetical protein QN277_016727 [Acacia crassicarpa]|uniref:VQ domain-containing protein n=1 Tax=Acacia crassicarpa TaxID=499986 RepID=A0AAE1TB83_9FABA|nr:hypothetical protein QN277_016727 [Acacia crassicarpa]